MRKSLCKSDSLYHDIQTVSKVHFVLFSSLIIHEFHNVFIDRVSESAVVVEASRGPPRTAQQRQTAGQQPPHIQYIQSGNQCPVCPIYFPPNCAEVDLEQHVNSHFTD